MAMENEDLFTRLFPSFFYAALQAFDKLRQRFIGSGPRNIETIAEPIVDLLALSGYAAIFSELNGKNFQKLVEQCWNKYFSALNDKERAKEMVNMLCVIAE